MNERVCSDALVMPSSTGTPVAGRLPLFSSFGVDLVELEAIDLLALEQCRSRRRRSISIFCSICRTITSICLSLIGHALQPVDLLDLVDEVVGQLLDALDRQDVVRRRIAVDDEVALLDEVAFLHRQMLLPLGIRYSTGSAPSSSGTIVMRRLFL